MKKENTSLPVEDACESTANGNIDESECDIETGGISEYEIRTEFLTILPTKDF